MVSSQDARRHDGDRRHHPVAPQPAELQVDLERNRGINHPRAESIDLPLEQIEQATNALLSEQGPAPVRGEQP